MAYHYILSEHRDGVAYLTINRPNQLNALNKATIEELNHAIIQADADTSVQCILLTGSGSKAFVAGADIKEFAHFNAQEGAQLATDGQRLLFDLLDNLSTPSIAAINGFALGGGLELAMACHLRLASPNAKFGQPEVNLGVPPGYGGTQRLPALIGKSYAMEIILTGDMIDAEKALQIGLVNQVVPGEKLLESTIIMAERIIKNSPNSIKSAIKAINKSDGTTKGFQEENFQFSNCFGTADFKEGITAFLEKRKPKF